MLGLIARILLVIAGVITSIFITRDALNFEFVQMVVAIILFSTIVLIAAFWPMLKSKFKKK